VFRDPGPAACGTGLVDACFQNADLSIVNNVMRDAGVATRLRSENKISGPSDLQIFLCKF
jgi:hypothetical protein